LRRWRQQRQLSQAQLATVLPVTPDQIAKYEKAVRWPGQKAVERIDEHLEAGGELVTLWTEGEAERETARNGRAPVDGSYVEHWTQLLSALAAAGNAVGGRRFLDIVTTEVAVISRFGAAATGQAAAGFLTAQARWLEFGSWIADNQGDRVKATVMLKQAGGLAEQARDTVFGAYVVMRRAQRAHEEDQPKVCLDLVDSVAVTSQPPRIRALLATRAAQAYAALGDGPAMRRLLKRAFLDACRDSAPDKVDLELASHSTPSYVLAHEGICLLTLGEPNGAASVLETVLQDWPASQRLDEGLIRAHLALAQAKTGALDESVDQARQALTLGLETGSERTLRGLVDILDQLAQANVAFQSATEPVDTSSAVGRMLVQMLGVFAQFEREILIDRVINAMERKAAKGEWCGGRPPHGYELDGDTKKLRIADGEDLHVRNMFTIFNEVRLGTKEVAKELNERGFRTTAGKPWSGNSILAMLRNRTYLGEVYFRGTWYRTDDHHPAIVDEETFTKAQQILDARSDDYSQRASANSEYALSGGIKCARCGAHYVGTAATGRNNRYRYYTCYTRARYGPKACPAERLPADEVESEMTAALLDTYQQTGLIHDAINVIGAEIAEANSKREQEVATIDASLAEIASKIDRYLQAFERGTMTDAAASERVTQLKEHQRELRAHRSRLDAEPVSEPVGPSIDELAGMREEIKYLIANGAPGARNALFRALVHEIQVTGRHKIKPYFRVPVNNGTPGVTPGVRIVTDWAPPLGLEPRTCRLTAGCSAN
jgi:site-specific DNA recombinase